MNHLLLVCLLLVTLPARGYQFGGAAADDPRGVERELEGLYRNKVLVLRTFYSGSNLRFRQSGDLEEGGKPGPWTLYSHIAAEVLKVNETRIEIKGQRLYLVASQDGKRFVPAHKDKVTIRIEIGPDPPSLTALQETLMRVFLRPEEKLEDFVPLYWKTYLIELVGGAKQARGLGPYRVGGTVSAPRTKSAPDPQYNELARKAKVQGTVVLWVVIGPDGRAQEWRLQRALGMGLDEEAVDVVRNWTFKPALMNGQPVAVQVNIEMNFRLY